MLRILLVEDNEIIVDLLSAAFVSWGYSYKVAVDGLSAISAVIKNDVFDVVVMDILMPGGMNGITVARLIRALEPPKSEMPIIALTGGMAITSMAELEAAGFAKILQKPVMLDVLHKAIKDER